MEQVTGTLHGRSGSFALQHFGSMQDGRFDLNIRAVPGSGTGELEGIAGGLTIVIESGRHSYSFEYTLPAVE
jgi:hypothetical protein